MAKIPCDRLCGAEIDEDTSKKIWVEIDGEEYQADLCEPCFVVVEAEIAKVGGKLTPHIRMLP